MTIPRLTAETDAAAVSGALRDHGCVIIDELVPASVCDAVAAELSPHIAATPAGADDFSGRTTRRTGALLARSEAVRQMIAHPLVLDAVEATLWPESSTFQLHLTQAITLGPGSPAQALHRDHWCFDFFPFPPDVDVEVASIWALDDFTEQNGATRIVPDSHRSTGMPHTVEDTEPAVMARGSVVLYVGGCVHGGGANTTDQTRTGINVDYALGWLRQEENQYLSVPHDIARDLPEDIQHLMGYRIGAFALGYIDDVRDPMEALRPSGRPISSLSPSAHRDPQ